MQAKSLTEEQAYALLRTTAMNEKRKIADVAQSVITAVRRQVLCDSLRFS